MNPNRFLLQHPFQNNNGGETGFDLFLNTIRNDLFPRERLSTGYEFHCGKTNNLKILFDQARH